MKSILENIDHKSYLKKDKDERLSKPTTFNFDVFELFGQLFSENELHFLNSRNSIYLERIKKIDKKLLEKELETITIEFAWKSSEIEGSEYSLLDTHALIKEEKHAEGMKKENAFMIMNHKKAIDYIFEHKQMFKEISVRKIEDLHRILVSDLGVDSGLRSTAVAITGTNYAPLDNQFQIREALEKTCELVNKTSDAYSKSLIMFLLISYIQPFKDGNKRSSRTLANAMLIANDICPLSFKTLSVEEYKEAIIMFYELNNAVLMKKLFMEQYDYAINNYFLN